MLSVPIFPVNFASCVYAYTINSGNVAPIRVAKKYDCKEFRSLRRHAAKIRRSLSFTVGHRVIRA